MPLNVYAEERKKIEEVGIIMQRKWNYLTDYKLNRDVPKSKKNIELMEEWAKEAQNRFLEAGFKVTVDITPAMANISPPTVSINDRVKPQLTDHERIAHEIKKEQKEKV